MNVNAKGPAFEKVVHFTCTECMALAESETCKYSDAQRSGWIPKASRAYYCTISSYVMPSTCAAKHDHLAHSSLPFLLRITLCQMHMKASLVSVLYHRNNVGIHALPLYALHPSTSDTAKGPSPSICPPIT